MISEPHRYLPIFAFKNKKKLKVIGTGLMLTFDRHFELIFYDTFIISQKGTINVWAMLAKCLPQHCTHTSFHSLINEVNRLW